MLIQGLQRPNRVHPAPKMMWAAQHRARVAEQMGQGLVVGCEDQGANGTGHTLDQTVWQS